MKGYIPFINERGYIQMEIALSNGEDRLYRKQELRRLDISFIPFSEKYFNKKKFRARKK